MGCKKFSHTDDQKNCKISNCCINNHSFEVTILDFHVHVRRDLGDWKPTVSRRRGKYEIVISVIVHRTEISNRDCTSMFFSGWLPDPSTTIHIITVTFLDDEIIVIFVNSETLMIPNIIQ